MESQKVLHDKLIKMKIPERIAYLKEINVNKETVLGTVDSMSVPPFAKMMLKNKLKKISDEAFITTIAANVELIPSSLLR